MSEEAQIVPTGLPFAGAATLIPLRSRAGWTVRLEPGQPQKCGWIPDDRRALELDVQLQILNAEGSFDAPPRVLWRYQQGHGALTYDVPRYSAADRGDAPQRGYVVPARGLRQRLAVREFTIELLLADPASEDEPGAVTLNCSFQPAHSGVAIVSPTSDMHLATVGPPCVLPIGATELRFCIPDTGLPFGAGPTVVFYDLFGNVLATPTLISYADWKAIPISAAFWGVPGEVGVDTQVVYR